MKRYNDGSPILTAEELVDLAWARQNVASMRRIHQAGIASVDASVKFATPPLEAYDFFDHVGVDRFLICRVDFGGRRIGKRVGVGVANGFIWIPIQIKASDNGQTVGLPLMLAKVTLMVRYAERLSQSMVGTMEEHMRKHPAVGFMLFVAIPDNSSAVSREAVLDDIWGQTMAMINRGYKNLIGRNLI